LLPIWAVEFDNDFQFCRNHGLINVAIDYCKDTLAEEFPQR
jgi:hypothetical protein